MGIDWNTVLADQLGWHWQNQLRPRLDGLTEGKQSQPTSTQPRVRSTALVQPA
jgi:hypothetical protein